MTAPRLVRLVAALAAAATLGTLAACTPAAKRVAALRSVDGHPTLLVAACDGFEADGVSVSTVGVTPRVQWDVDRDTGAASTEVRLLQLPAGWTVTEGTLTAFEPGREYTVSAADGGETSFPVHFTVEELAALAPDQVLVGEAAGERKAVTESEFRREAKESC
ncbi:hypothetical protein [Micromonospora sp. WMMD812]|uniref:hypothetical protein n=1 Tax=Micromonospora sp. WMMD812 TaxID=3015152 RepID=UPI00248CF7F4|nr:hypothetical protein [Micromonospora sp. WMMD812]WBB69526.1 hypothetical protein O7603_09300 [Micromonospora sp. WMMD812]